MTSASEGSGSVSEVVAKVDSQLSAFWAKATDETGATTARSSTMNFVALSATADLDEARKRIEDLAETRAGRAFLMTVSGKLPPWELQSEVSSVCHKQGEAVICYDRVELVFGAMVAARASSVLSALALSEVPTIVEVGRGVPASLVDPLSRSATRLIVDSAHTSVTRLAEIAEKTRAPLGDRAFVRTFTWREILARFFDEAPGAERAIGRIEIERSVTSSCDPAAMLLGWLGSRLGWTFTTAESAVDAEGLPIDIRLRKAEATEEAEIAAVRIVAATAGRPLFCTAERPGNERHVHLRVSGPRSANRQVALGFRDEGWVLGKAIDGVEGDAVYRAALAQAAVWARLSASGAAS